LQLAEITLSVSWAADLMWRLFEKRRPQVVALWKTEKGTGSRFDQVRINITRTRLLFLFLDIDVNECLSVVAQIFQQDFKYDLARMKVREEVSYHVIDSLE
jgi:hypothetical protein